MFCTIIIFNFMSGEKQKEKVLINQLDYTLFGTVFFLYSSGFLLNELSRLYSFPPLFTVIRIAFNLLLWQRIFVKKYKLGKNALFLILCFFVLSLYYLSICFIEGKILSGILALRIYLEPLLFAFLIYIYYYNGLSLKKMLGVYVKVVIVTAVLSFITYIAFYTGNITYFVEEVPETSFLPGLIFRSYLPIGCPNQLGLLLLSGIILAYFSDLQYKRTIVLFLFISLLITVSKSAIIALVFFCLIFNLNDYKRVLNILVFCLFLSCFIIVNFILFKDSPLFIYIYGLFSGDDPSSNGHLSSLIEAIERFPEYYLFGYPTGTVGSRMETIYNVESSFFILIYDKGLLFMAIYLCLVLMLLAKFLKTNIVRTYILSIALALSVLPTIQSLECFSLILVSPMLLHGVCKINKYKVCQN